MNGALSPFAAVEISEVKMDQLQRERTACDSREMRVLRAVTALRRI